MRMREEIVRERKVKRDSRERREQVMDIDDLLSRKYVQSSFLIIEWKLHGQ